MKRNLVISSGNLLVRVILLGFFLAWLEAAPEAVAQVHGGASRLSLSKAAILVDSSEPSYVQYGAQVSWGLFRGDQW